MVEWGVYKGEWMYSSEQVFSGVQVYRCTLVQMDRVVQPNPNVSRENGKSAKNTQVCA